MLYINLLKITSINFCNSRLSYVQYFGNLIDDFLNMSNKNRDNMTDITLNLIIYGAQVDTYSTFTYLSSVRFIYFLLIICCVATVLVTVISCTQIQYDGFKMWDCFLIKNLH